MKKATKLKAFMLSLIMTALLLPMTSFAQQTSDDFFRVDDAFNDNRAVAIALTGNIANDDFGTPLGSGLLILTAVGAGYAIARRKRSFRKGTALMLAALLLLGMTDCKKKAADPIVPASVKITLNVSGDNDGSKVVVNPPRVTFENGDKVLVGYNGKYVGTLTHNGSNFSGSISAEIAGSQPLYFYFVGNKDTGTLTEGTTTSCTVNISDQSTELPVLSYSQSTENFIGAGTYYASLHNQCGLVKFTLAKAAGSVQVGGMHTEATINFETPAITPTATTGSVSLNSKSKTEKWAILLPQDAVVGAAVTVGSENLTVDVPAITRNAYITDIPTIANTQIDISQLSDNYEAQDGDILYGTIGGNYKITIAADATVTLNSVTINGTNNSSYAWAGITCVGNATIILKDGSTNNVKGFYEDYPGIHVPEGSTLTIRGESLGTGKLVASSNTDGSLSGAGIGGGWNLACGNIVIQGGDITATGSAGAAGIGSNNKGCGNITISGGTVTANGGYNAAGIGSGNGGNCGDITISGGTVTATGGASSAGIGSGNAGRCSNITITNTVTRVTATKGNDALESIGRGYNCTSIGTVTVGGVVGAISTSPYTYIPAPYNANTTPLTFEAKADDFTVTLTSNLSPLPSLEYSIDGGAWTTYTCNAATPSVNTGHTIAFRGDNTRFFVYDGSVHASNFTCSQDCYLYGNMMSLLSASSYATATSVGEDAFLSLFDGNTNIYSHDTKALVLPATTLARSCYESLFKGCTHLTIAPNLPAETLAENCYASMFYKCTDLVNAPVISASTLATHCCDGMFIKCTSLTTGPTLSATTLTDYCYSNMFQNCSNLNSVTCLATTNLSASGCTFYWLDDVASTGTFTAANSSVAWTDDASGIPSGWTRVNAY